MNNTQRRREARDADREAKGLRPRTTIGQRRQHAPVKGRTVTETELLNARDVVMTRNGIWLPPPRGV